MKRAVSPRYACASKIASKAKAFIGKFNII